MGSTVLNAMIGIGRWRVPYGVRRVRVRTYESEWDRISASASKAVYLGKLRIKYELAPEDLDVIPAAIPRTCSKDDCEEANAPCLRVV